MGRELQKKKRRSGNAKITRKPKSKKQILNNPIIAANWDSKQTLSQNYARLGLTARLNKQTGGKEQFNANKGVATAAGSLAVHPSGHAPMQSKKASQLNSRHEEQDPTAEDSKLYGPEAKVERDPETGAILRVVEPELQRPADGNGQPRRTTAEQTLHESGRKPLNVAVGVTANESRQPEEDEDEIAGFADSHASDGFIGAAALAEASNPVVKELSQAALAAQAQPKVKRRQSERERSWCGRVVAKHGQDYAAMLKDRKMNVLQLSEGDMKRKIKAYLEDGV